MSIRFSVSAAASESIDQGVVIDAHHIDTSGGWFEHPIRSHTLGIGRALHLMAHVALGFVVHIGNRDALVLTFEHGDPTMSHGLEWVVVADGEGFDAVEWERQVIAPGATGSVTLRRGSHLRLRELRMGEVRNG